MDQVDVSRMARLILTYPEQDREAYLTCFKTPDEREQVRAEMAAQLEQRAKGAARCK